ncbi:MAG: hypothetical protein Q9217_002736 [Psora testacea]
MSLSRTQLAKNKIGFSPTKKESFTSSIPASELAAGFLHVLLPASEANIGFCRTSLSSALLGYPLPQVTNWEKIYDDEKFGASASEWGSLLGTLRYLEGLLPERDEDLVLVTDIHDTWFQLRSEVLIQRYRDITREAEKRVRKRLGNGTKVQGLKQDLVFAAQKQCQAGSKDDISCYAAPKSPLPKSTYGDAKHDAEHDLTIEVESRPRYLHAGLMMGSANSMRNAFRSAYEKWQVEPNAYKSRREVFAEMFGEQEYQYEAIRLQRLTSLQRFSRWWTGEASFLEIHPKPKSMQDRKDLFEYGISLDYAGSLGQVVSSPENDADWIRYSDPNTISTAATMLDISTSTPKIIQRDLEHSRPPFWSLAPVSDAPNLPKQMGWRDLPLYTNLWTGVTPALILQRPDGSPEQVNSQWKQMWYQPYIRAKLDTLAREPVYPIASETLGNNNGEKTWWTSVVTTPADKGREGFGFLVKGEEWRRWTDVCPEDDQSHIFEDGAGKWTDPKIYPPYD